MSTQPTIEEIKQQIKNWDGIRNTMLGYRLLNSGSGFIFRKKDFDKWNNNDLSKSVHIYLGYDKINNLLKFYFIDEENDSQKRWIPGTTIFGEEFVHPDMTFDDLTDRPINTDVMQRFISDSQKDMNDKLASFIRELLIAIDHSEPHNITEKKTAVNRTYLDIFDSITDNNSLSLLKESLRSYLQHIVPTYTWLIYGHNWFKELSRDQNVVRAFSIPKQNFTKLFGIGEDVQDAVFLSFAQKKGRIQEEPAVTYDNRIDMYIYTFKKEFKPANATIPEFMRLHHSKNVATPCPPYCRLETFPLLSDFTKKMFEIKFSVNISGEFL